MMKNMPGLDDLDGKLFLNSTAPIDSFAELLMSTNCVELRRIGGDEGSLFHIGLILKALTDNADAHITEALAEAREAAVEGSKNVAGRPVGQPIHQQ